VLATVFRFLMSAIWFRNLDSESCMRVGGFKLALFFTTLRAAVLVSTSSSLE
jgi:hypothetical protein